MLLLALDTSAGASVALLRSENDGAPAVLYSADTQAPNAHAEWLAPAVAEALSQAGLQGAELDGVVVGAGPGPFTGLRVGLALAHALAEGWEVPVHGVCSLDSLALRATDAGITGEFLVATDARRSEVYWAHYESDHEGSRLVAGPFVAPAADLPALDAVGAGVGLYPEQLRSAELGSSSSSWTPQAAELGQLAHGALSGQLHGVLCAPRPLYLRESDAKVPVQMQAGNRKVGP